MADKTECANSAESEVGNMERIFPSVMHHPDPGINAVTVLDETEEKYLHDLGWLDREEHSEIVKKRQEADLAALETEQEAARLREDKQARQTHEDEKERQQKELDRKQAAKLSAAHEQKQASVVRRQSLLAEVYRAQVSPLEQRRSRLRDQESTLADEAAHIRRGGKTDPKLYRAIVDIQEELASIADKLSALERQFEANY